MLKTTFVHLWHNPKPLIKGDKKMITIAIANQKGGVGKTTISFNIAQILSSHFNYKILAIDNDPQGNLTSSFIADPSKLNGNILGAYKETAFYPEQLTENLDFLGANTTLAHVAESGFHVIYNLKQSLENLFNSSSRYWYDFVIIDCLPSFSYLHLAALHAADFVLIPVKPAPYALAGMQDLFFTIGKVQKNMNPGLSVLGIIINQVDGRKPILQREMEEALRETYQDLVFTSMINKRIKIEESPALQKAITEHHPAGPSAKEFTELVEEIIGRLKKTGGLK